MSQLQWMNFPLVWHSLPSGLINREPSPVLLYRLPSLSQHPPALQLLSGAGGGAARCAADCRACSCSRARCRSAVPLPSSGRPIWIGWTVTGDPPPVPAIGPWAVAPVTASATTRKTSGRFISGYQASITFRRPGASEVHRNLRMASDCTNSPSHALRRRRNLLIKRQALQPSRLTAASMVSRYGHSIFSSRPALFLTSERIGL